MMDDVMIIVMMWDVVLERWFFKHFLCSPRFPGEMIQLDDATLAVQAALTNANREAENTPLGERTWQRKKCGVKQHDKTFITYEYTFYLWTIVWNLSIWYNDMIYL